MSEEYASIRDRFLHDRDHNEIKSALEEILVKDPRNVMVLIDLSTALGHLGLLEEALSAVQMALDIEPDNPEAHFRISWVYYKLRDLHKARNHARSATQMAPHVGKYYYGMVPVALAFKEMDTALEYIETAHRLDPSVLNVRGHVVLWSLRVVLGIIGLRWILAVGMAATYIFLYELGLSGFGYKLLLISLPFVGAGGYYLIQHRYRRALGAFLLGVLWCGAVYAGVRLFFM